MKQSLTLLIISLFFSGCEQNKVTANPGEKMMVITNFIKYDKKQEFEDIVLNEVIPSYYSYRDSVDELHSLNQKAKNTFRFQKPVQMNEDSTWTFVFMGDPYFDGANYYIGKPLRKVISLLMVHTLVEFYQLDFSSCTPLFEPEAFHLITVSFITISIPTFFRNQFSILVSYFV